MCTPAGCRKGLHATVARPPGVTRDEWHEDPSTFQGRGKGGKGWWAGEQAVWAEAKKNKRDGDVPSGGQQSDWLAVFTDIDWLKTRVQWIGDECWLVETCPTKGDIWYTAPEWVKNAEQDGWVLQGDHREELAKEDKPDELGDLVQLQADMAEGPPPGLWPTPKLRPTPPSTPPPRPGQEAKASKSFTKAASPKGSVAGQHAKETAPKANVPEPAPKASAPDPATKASAPKPAPSKTNETAPKASAPEPAPKVSAPEPAPKVSAPEPATKASAPEPAPSKQETDAKKDVKRDLEEKKAKKEKKVQVQLQLDKDEKKEKKERKEKKAATGSGTMAATYQTPPAMFTCTFELCGTLTCTFELCGTLTCTFVLGL